MAFADVHTKNGQCACPAHIASNYTTNTHTVNYTVPPGVVVTPKAAEVFGSLAAAKTARDAWIATCNSAPIV